MWFVVLTLSYVVYKLSGLCLQAVTPGETVLAGRFLSLPAQIAGAGDCTDTANEASKAYKLNCFRHRDILAQLISLLAYYFIFSSEIIVFVFKFHILVWARTRYVLIWC